MLKYRKKLLILAALAVFTLTTGFGCKGGSLDAKKAIKEPITLNIWGVFDSQDSFNDLIAAYNINRPQVKIKYRKLQFVEYEHALLEAWAEDRGPDIFMVHNTWIGGYVNKIQAAPEKIKIATANITGSYKKKVEAFFTEYPSITPEQIKSQFIAVVAQDAVRNGKILGLPLAVDTLILYYNRSLLDQAGIASVPATWQEVKEASKILTLYDEDGKIIRSGIALGGADNINRSFDILSLLMAQNGTVFLNPDGNLATFSKKSPFSSDSYIPGQEALRFYTDFANPSKEVYTWSENLQSAYESFISGQLGMMLGYSYQLPLLKMQGPKVNLGIAPAPHINSNGTDAAGKTINWANYWLLSPSKSTEHLTEAWDFIHFAATKPEMARLYLNKTKKPTALRSLITEQLADPDLQPFASQLLTAKSWYIGENANMAENFFKDMVSTVIQGKTTVKEAIKNAEALVNQTLR